MTSLPYSVQRKKAYVLINLTIRSANKKPWAYPLSAALPFTDTYIKPSGLSILFPFSISIEGVEGGSEEGNDSGGGDCRRDDCGEGGEGGEGAGAGPGAGCCDREGAGAGNDVKEGIVAGICPVW